MKLLEKFNLLLQNAKKESDKNEKIRMSASSDPYQNKAFLDLIAFTEKQFKTSMSFGEAIDAIEKGEMIAREGWNGKGLFVFKQIPAEIALDIIPKMQSVPQKVKAKMIASKTTLKYNKQLAIVCAEGKVNSWSPSVADTLANDWYIVD